MDINKPLPTTVKAVEDELKSIAEDGHSYPTAEDFNGRNAFLLGMAVYKLAEANTEIVRLRKSSLPTWECGCGTVNGVNLAMCSVCHRDRSETR